MTQVLLPFQYQEDPTKSQLTALAGLPLFLDLMKGLGVIESLRECLDFSDDMRGWSVSDVVIALMMVKLAGGDCVEDLDQLNSDLGFAKVLELVHRQGIT